MTEQRIVPGVYDKIVSEALARVLEDLPSDLKAFRADFGSDREAAAHALARLIHERALATLRSLPSTDEATSVERQIALTNALLAQL